MAKTKKMEPTRAKARGSVGGILSGQKPIRVMNGAVFGRECINVPGAVPILERRRFIRHPLVFPLKYKVIKGSREASLNERNSATVDISQGGLMFSARHPVAVDSKIMINMPFEDKVFNVRTRVVHCNKNPETRLYEIGVCFYRLKEAFKVKLIEQIYLISEYRDLRSLELGKEISLEEASREWIKRYSERFRRLYGW